MIGGYQIIHICTAPDDDYDRTVEIQKFADRSQGSTVFRKSDSGADSGVTLHKLSEQFDAGDILLQEKIKIEQEDHLVTLLEKIKKFP